MRTGLTYDDVLLIPKKTSVYSRKDTETKARLTKGIILNIPIISANMDTVTESSMAITMAKLGGIGIIHRFLSIEEQAREVKIVKSHEAKCIENPITISPDKTIYDALQLMKKNNISGIIVVKDNKVAGIKKVVGIITNRDVRIAEDIESQKKYLVKDLMTKNLVSVSRRVANEEAKRIMHKHKIEKLPIVKNGILKGLITLKDIYYSQKYPHSTKDKKGRLMVGAAIGLKDYKERSKKLVESGVDVLVLDIAHGHSIYAIKAIKELKRKYDIPIIAGNVATSEGTRDLIKAGADAIKVGVGPGSICITRIVTGSGVPQLTAIMDSYKTARKYGIPIIADGGIKTSGDIAKAIVAGADTVMLGSMLAGTDESPGTYVIKNKIKYKIIRGMASRSANLKKNGKLSKDFVPEGVEGMVPYKGKTEEIINELIGGLRSSISYCGAKNLKEMKKNGEFIRITSAGMRESHSHDIEI